MAVALIYNLHMLYTGHSGFDFGRISENSHTSYHYGQSHCFGETFTNTILAAIEA